MIRPRGTINEVNVLRTHRAQDANVGSNPEATHAMSPHRNILHVSSPDMDFGNCMCTSSEHVRAGNVG